jgi:hypothetical protein
MNTVRLVTFALDRMSLLNISVETFAPIMENPAQMFESVIGIAIRVLKPAGLVEDIRRNLREAMEYYK